MNMNLNTVSNCKTEAQPTRSKTPAISSDLTTPDAIAKDYRFVRKLGQGSQGKVFEATRLADGKRVAIKQLEIASIKNWKTYELFERESNVLRSLDIDGIAHLYETRECLDGSAPCAYLVQQYIDGQTLAQMLQNGYRFSITATFELALQLIDLLEKLHKHDPCIIHRDIKPSNIMLEPTDQGYKLFLIDFGAVANPIVQKGGSTVAGTFGYMPPEQQTGRPTPASDMYAVGATLCYVLSGVDPADMQVVEYRLAIEQHLQSMPNAIVTCLRQMLMPREEDRLCDYEKLRKLFKAFASNNFNDLTEFDNNIKNIIDEENYNNALKRVRKIADSGNLSLWLNLPESTPRQIPNCYKHITWNHPISKRSLFHIDWKIFEIMLHGLFIFIFFILISIILSKYCFKYCFKGACTIIFPVSFFFWIGNLTILCMNFPTDYLPVKPQSKLESICIWYLKNHLPSKVFYAPFSVCIIFMLPVIFSSKKHGEALLYSKLPSQINLNKHQKEVVDDLLRNGRKSLATVVNISYHSSGKNAEQWSGTYDTSMNSWIKWTTPQNNSKGFLKSLTNTYRPWPYLGGYNHSATCFSIRYKFNPPDDANPDDLFHTIRVPFDPRSKLKPGDVIPILYVINANNKADVTSMPFPLPLADMDDAMNYIGHSNDDV